MRQAKYAKWETPINDTKVTLCQGTLQFKKKGSESIQTLQIAGGNLTLNCNEANLVRKRLILFNDNHIKVGGGQLILSKNNKLSSVFKSTDLDEELHIEGGSLRVKYCTSHGDEEATIDFEYGTKVKLAKGGTLTVAYNGQCCLVIKGGNLVGMDVRCMCFTKCLNTVSGAATCFILTTIVMSLLFLSLLAILICYYVFIPINKSISNAADRLIGIYQSTIVIVGALFAYKTLFKSKPSGIQGTVKGRKKPLTEGAQGTECFGIFTLFVIGMRFIASPEQYLML